MSQNADSRVPLGRIGAPHGVKGWVRVNSSTQPIDNILDYPVWQIGQNGNWREFRLKNARMQSKGLVVLLEDEHGNAFHDRNQAAELTNADIAVDRSELPPLPEGEYYWADLIGLTVSNESGEVLGEVDHLIETGANNVLVLKGEREILVPFVMDHVVKNVDLQSGSMTVDWDPDF